MKMRMFRAWCSGLLAAVCSIAAPMTVAAAAGNGNEAQVQEAIGKGVDYFGSSSGSVESIAEAFADALRDNSNEKQLDGLVKGLENVGIEGGWAKQIGKLKKIGGVANFLSKAVNSLNNGVVAGDLIAAAQNRDRTAFQQIIADQLTGMAADFIAGQISNLVYKHATGVAATGLVSGGWTLIWAGVEFAAGVFIDAYGGGLIQEAIQTTFINDLLLDLGGAIYDSIFSDKESGEEGTSSDNGNGSPDDGNGMMCKPGDDPFDSQPESDGGESGEKKGRYQGLKDIKLF